MDLFEVLLEYRFVPVKTDLYVPDIMPLAFTRTYCPLDEWARRAHLYLPHVYDPYLAGDRFPYTYAEWYLPDRQLVPYHRISQGTGYSDALFEHSGSDDVFGGSRLGWNGDGWDLSLPNGTTFLSPEAYYATRPQQGSLVGIFDKEGHEVRLLRKPNGDLTEVKSPSGQWIRFAYNEGRIVQARASAGDFVNYDYDPDDRLRTATYSTGETIAYSYDSANRIVRVEDPSTGFALENKYDAKGFLTEQKLADGHTYRFQASGDLQKGSRQIEIIASHEMTTTLVRMHEEENGIHYTVEKRVRPSPGHR